MKKSLTALLLLIAGLMVVGRVVNSAEDQAQVLDEEIIVEDAEIVEANEPEDLPFLTDTESIPEPAMAEESGSETEADEPEAEDVESGMEESEGEGLEERVESAVNEYMDASDAGESETSDETDTATSAEDQLISIDSNRDLSQGIEVTSEDAEEDLITLTLDDVPLQDVIRMFTKISGANIVAGTNLQGRVTVSLRDVEWKPALDVILDSVDRVLIEKQTGIYMIMSRSDLASEPVVNDILLLEFVTVSNVLPVVQGMITSTNGNVTPVVSANALAVQETVERLAHIREVVNKIDKPRPQVFIEAKFVELNESFTKDVGIDWEPLRDYSVSASGLTRSFTETITRQEQDAVASRGSEFDNLENTFTRSNTRDRTDTSGSTSDSTLAIPGGFTLTDSTTSSSTDTDGFSESDVLNRRTGSTRETAFLRGRNVEGFEEGELQTVPTYFSEVIQSAVLSADDFTLTLSALEDRNGVSIVSNPKIIVANGETAQIHVGRNQPNIVAVPTGDTGDRFAYTLDDQNPFIEIGVKVNVTPQVNTESNITVRIVPELSRLLGFQEVGQVGVSFPITQIRKIVTEFNLASGYTVAIGGLTETSDSTGVKKIPLLGDIPVIGKYVFSKTSEERVQDEVIIFVTVGLANPESLVEVTGVPSKGRLIHQHLAEEALEASDAP